MLGQTLQLTALFYLNQGRLDESEATYREALALFRAINPKHFEVGKCKNGLALIASRRGRYAKAEKTMVEVEALFREVLGEKHPFTWQVRGNRASQIALQGRLEEAEAIEREVAAKLEELNGKDCQEAVDARVAARGDAAPARPRRRGPARAPGGARRRRQDGRGDEHLGRDAALPGRRGSPGAGRAEDRAEAQTPSRQALAVLEKQSPPPPAARRGAERAGRG